jgi:ribonuclease P protein component
MGIFSFGKDERLSKEKWIKELFEKGSSFYFHPFKVLYLPHPDASSPKNQVMFSVPKRMFKRAVDRNAIKRRLREAWRLNKNLFNNPEEPQASGPEEPKASSGELKVSSGKKWLIAYIYTAKTILPTETFQQKVLGSIHKLTSLKK